MLVTKVVGVVTTNLNDVNVIDVQEYTIILFRVVQALLATNVGIEGRVCIAKLIMLEEEGLDHGCLVEGDSYTQLPLANQVIRKATLETVLHSLVFGVSTVANKVPVVATNITVMTDFDCYV